MGLDVRIRTDKLTVEKTEIFNDINTDLKNLQDKLKSITPGQLANIIKENFMKDGQMKSPEEIKKSPSHTVIVQMILDLFNVNDSELDKRGGIDGLYGTTTTNLVNKLKQDRRGMDSNCTEADFFARAIQELEELKPSLKLKRTVPPLKKTGNLDQKEKLLQPGQFYQGYPSFGNNAHEYPASSQNLKNQLSKLFNANIRDKTVTVNFGAGTDSTPPRRGTIANATTYKNKMESIITEMKEYGSITEKNKETLEKYIRSNKFGTDRPVEDGFQNNRLLGLRNLEVVRQSIKAWNNRELTKGTGQSNSNVQLILNYDNKLDKAGGERFVTGSVTGNTIQTQPSPQRATV